MASDNLSRKFHIEKNYMESPINLGDFNLVQIGRTHCTKDYVIADHIHRNWFEITVVNKGLGEIITNGVKMPIKEGDIYLSFPGDVHAINTDNISPLKYSFLSVWPQNSFLLEKFELVMDYFREPEKRLFKDSNVEYLVGNALSEVFSEDEHSKEIFVSAVNQILRYTLRNFLGGKTFDFKVDCAQELCYQIMNYINTHIYTMDGLNELSAKFGYSYSYLSDSFHKTTGETLKSFYTGRRLDAAIMLLKEESTTLSEIAELLRYSSVCTFSRAFKKRFGKSPSEYKAHNVGC